MALVHKFKQGEEYICLLYTSIYKGFKKDYIIIENQGIGYKIFTSGSTMAALPDLDRCV